MPFSESNARVQARVRAFRQELAKLGWAEGSNVQFDVGWTTDEMDLVRAAAADLVWLKPDVIVTAGDRVIPVLAQLTRSIPISRGERFGRIGLRREPRAPRGNVTGFSVIEFSIVGKMVLALKQMAPGISRVGMIYNSDNAIAAVYLNWFKAVASELAVQPIDLPVHGLSDIEHVIESLAVQPYGGFIVPPDVSMSALGKEVTLLAARHGVPAVYSNSVFVRQGGLASYGADTGEVWQGLASYVHRILHGEKPGDLPVQQPTSSSSISRLRKHSASTFQPNCSHSLTR